MDLNFSLIASGLSATTYADSNVPPGAYIYTVTAYDAANFPANPESNWAGLVLVVIGNSKNIWDVDHWTPNTTGDVKQTWSSSTSWGQGNTWSSNNTWN